MLNISEKQKHILIIGPLPPPYYGGSIFTEALVRGLEKRNWFVISHIDTQANKTLQDVGKTGGFRKIISISQQIIKVLCMAISSRPDMLYFPMPAQLEGFLRHSIFVYIAKLIKAQSVVQFHDGQFNLMYQNYPKIMQKYARKSLEKVSRIIVLGHNIAPMLEGIVDHNKVRVVFGGRDELHFLNARERVKKLSKTDNGPVKVLFVSNLFRDKGYFDVLQAAPLVLKEYPNLFFQFAGNWPSLEECEFARDYLEAHGVGDKVHFLGPVLGEKKYDMFISADIFVLPSYYRFEAQPAVVIEAMAAGLPIVATDWAGLPEMVQDGVNGFIVPIAHPEAIADRILKLALDPLRRCAMGDRGLELFRSKFSQERWLRDTAAVFREAMTERTR